MSSEPRGVLSDLGLTLVPALFLASSLDERKAMSRSVCPPRGCVRAHRTGCFLRPGGTLPFQAGGVGGWARGACWLGQWAPGPWQKREDGGCGELTCQWRLAVGGVEGLWIEPQPFSAKCMGRVAWFLVSPLKHTSLGGSLLWGHLPETTQVEKEPLLP